MAKKPSFKTTQRLIEKLNDEFDFNLKPDTKFDTYNGSADAGASRWYSLNIQPEIHSDITITEFLRAKEVGYSYVSWGSEGVFVTNEQYNPNSRYSRKSEKPEFTYFGF